MIDRINLILRAKNITAKQFAEEIGIQPSGMSHILGGRNNPSLEFVNKVLRRYPEIDANWLLLGRGQMYGEVSGGGRPSAAEGLDGERAGEPTLFGESAMEPLMAAEPRHEPMTQQEAIDEELRLQVPPPPAVTPYRASYIASAPEPEAPADSPRPAPEPAADEPDGADGRRLERLLFIYNDHTFAEYRPR